MKKLDVRDRTRRLNNILKAVRNIDKLIIRESDLEKLLSGSCSILQEVREYFHVAITVYGDKVEKLAESERGGNLEVGEETPDCIKELVELGDLDNGPVILDDIKEHCGKCPYHKEKQSCSIALIPFNTREGLKLLAVFADINHFDSEEIELLKEVSDDIGFAIDKHTAGKEHRSIGKEKEEQQRLLQAIVNSTPDFVVFKDRGQVYKMVNKSFCQFVNKDQEEIVGKTDYDIFPPDEAEMYRRDDLYLMETGKTQIQDEEVTGAEGKLWLQVAKTPVYDHAGNVLGLLCSVRDVSERKNFEKALQESEQKYRTTFEHTGTAMMILEEDRSISLVNEEFERLTGYTKKEVETKMSLKDLLHPDDLSKMDGFSCSHLKSNATRSEFRIVDKKGEVRHVFLAIGNIPRSQKSVASLMDITDFRRLNKLLDVYSEINELVAKEKNPEVVLKSVCAKLSLFYNFVFTSLKKNGELVPVESAGIDFDSMNRVIKSCPSVSRAMNGHIMKMKMENSLCKQCTAEPHRYALSIPLIHPYRKNRGVITVHSNSDFSKDEIKLLEKLSSNIAFALSAYELENDRRAAMEQLAQNLAQFDNSADRLRNPLAVIINSLELVEEIGSDNVLELVKEHSIRIKKELDEMREEEKNTYELTAESIREI
ncbi:MAG: PAS domain S-box protein [Archaeoglobaceae archaeon]